MMKSLTFLLIGSCAIALTACGTGAEKVLEKDPSHTKTVSQKVPSKTTTAKKTPLQQVIHAHKKALFYDPTAPIMGNPDGDVTLVKFFDYNCGYCRKMNKVVEDMAKKDPSLRVVLRPLPMLGENSKLAAIMAIAAHKQGKFEVLHNAFMKSSGHLGQKQLIALAKKVKLDMAQLNTDMQSGDANNFMKETFKLANALKIRGVPATVTKDTIVNGFRPLKDLKQLVANQRATQ